MSNDIVRPGSINPDHAKVMLRVLDCAIEEFSYKSCDEFDVPNTDVNWEFYKLVMDIVCEDMPPDEDRPARDRLIGFPGVTVLQFIKLLLGDYDDDVEEDNKQ
jgi:hypothetical protein